MRRFFQASNYKLNLMSLKKKKVYVLNCVYLDSDVYSMQVLMFQRCIIIGLYYFSLKKVNNGNCITAV